MTTKHTPGPWTVETGNFYVSVRAPSRMIGDTRIIGGKPDGENHANARLIAAAPDLLKALKAALEAIEIAQSFEGDVFGIHHNDVMDTICDASKAIAKARGEDA